jgi:type II secretion system protein I
MIHPTCKRGFTMLEVMIAVAFIGIALLALLSLHHSDMQSVIRGQDLTKAAMLAQSVMTQAEVERFPDIGWTQGEFSSSYSKQYPNFKWQRTVERSPLFADVRRVRVRILFGPGFQSAFNLTEFMHNPNPPPRPPRAPQSSDQGPNSDAGGDGAE